MGGEIKLGGYCQKRGTLATAKSEVIEQQDKKDSQKSSSARVGTIDLKCSQSLDFFFLRPLPISNIPMYMSGLNSLRIPCTSAGRGAVAKSNMGGGRLRNFSGKHTKCS